MPRYYFHLHNDVDARDEEGVELPDLDAARAHAANNALFTLSETAKEQGQINLDHHIDIEDGAGRVPSTVHFRDVIRIDGSDINKGAPASGRPSAACRLAARPADPATCRW